MVEVNGSRKIKHQIEQQDHIRISIRLAGGMEVSG